MPKHRAGGKVTGSHTTVTDAAAVVVDAAEKHEPVSKIVLGIIERVTSRKRRLAFREIQAGWQVNVVDNASIQTIYVYTSEKEATRQQLYESWPSR